jgi:molecular chaperone GrpE
MPNDMSDHEFESKPRPDKTEESQSQELLTHPSYEEMSRKLDEAEQKANQHWERILRMQAESDNAMRRMERDVANAHKFALEKFVTELLPIVDSLELCVANVPANRETATQSIIEGVDLTLKMFYTALEKFGVEQVNPLSSSFDPEFQQAISMQHDPSVKPGTVISVLQKGYILNNRLLRPALVTVAKAEK